MNIQVFNYESNQIRTVEHENNIWFVAKDVCDILGLANVTKAISTLEDDEKMTLTLSEGHSGKRGGAQLLNIINESGLYALILRSNKPNAKKFRKWVTATVLPSIRQHGFYATPDTAQKIINDPDTFIKVLQELKSLQSQAEINKPKVIFADAVNASGDSILIENLAKILCQNGINIGRNRLFIWLRENGYLMKFAYGERKNMPTQRSIEQGLFEVKTSVINNPDGTIRVHHTSKVTGKGQQYFINLFLSQNQSQSQEAE